MHDGTKAGEPFGSVVNQTKTDCEIKRNVHDGNVLHHVVESRAILRFSHIVGNSSHQASACKQTWREHMVIAPAS